MKITFIAGSILFLSINLAAQNVGIGTTTPSKPLDVALPGGIQISRTENGSANNEIFFTDNGQIRSLDNFHRIVFNRTNDQMEFNELGKIIFKTGNPLTEVMRITSDGTVGIGTAQPYFDLHIHNPNTTAAVKFTNSITGNTPLNGADIGQFGYNFSINNWENGSIFLNTNHLQRVTIDPAGNVGIGTNSPATKLHVIGTAFFTDNLGIGTATPAAKLDVEGNVKFADGTQGDGKVLTSDASGVASWKDAPAKQVYFLASRKFTNYTNTSADNILILDSLWSNDGNAYNFSTGIFTAPSSGLYFFYMQVEWASASTYTVTSIRKNGLWSGSSQQELPSISYYGEQSKVTAVFKLTAGETVDFMFSGGGTFAVAADYRNRTFITGYKIY